MPRSIADLPNDPSTIRDIRNTALFGEVERVFAAASRPGQGFVSDIADLRRSPNPSRLLFTGTLVDSLDAPGATRICEYDPATASTAILTSGPNSERHARVSPDGTTIGFLSDRARESDYQLCFLDPTTRAVTLAPAVQGWIEYFEWSPDGGRILLGVAGHGADLSSGHGAYTTDQVPDGGPAWMPHVTGGSTDMPWRKAWILDVAAGTLSCASPGRQNIWEAAWCGQDRIAVVRSDDPGEGAWYAAELAIADLNAETTTTLYTPTAQIALPRPSPSGQAIAFIEAISSDREYVAGDLRLHDLRDGTCRPIDTDGVDATGIEWIADDRLLVAGHRGLETVVLSIDISTGPSRELWKDTLVSTSNRYASVLALDRPDDFALVAESFFQRPRIATVSGGAMRIAAAVVPDDDWGGGGRAEAVRWQAPDGLLLEGWLLRPASEPPYPTIVEIHGGPVLHWRPYWLGRSAATLMLLRRGYAIFLPNPRGSSGRGQDFAARVVGDVGGADTADYLSGIDHLVAANIADPARLGVTGLSYGGFMTCWLTTQDPRFAAAIAVGPATNHVSHHLLCNIPQFVSLFVTGHYTDPASAYHSRSPIMYAGGSRTPTLLVCGDLDRCTPAEEAVQFHHALLENGVESVVIRYPQEGHGVRGMPAAIDFAARCMMWFENHMPADAAARRSAEDRSSM